MIKGSKSPKSRIFTRQEWSWILYDWASSAHSLIIVTAIFPIYYKQLAGQAGESDVLATARLGYANSVAAIIVALAAPFLGILADYGNNKLRLFKVFLAASLTLILAMTLIRTGMWQFALLLYTLSMIGYSGALVFYDSLLVDVSKPDNYDRVSTAGYGYGYIGSVIPFVVAIGLLLLNGFSLPEAKLPVAGMRWVFVVTFLWWGAFSLPLLKNVRQSHGLTVSSSPLLDSGKRLLSTFALLRKNRKAFVFIIAYFFYIDGVDTIYKMAAAYGLDAGLSTFYLLLILLGVQFVAFPCAIIYGRLTRRYGAVRLLYFGLGVFCLVTLIGFFLPTIPKDKTLPVFIFISFLVGSSLGGVQALSRSCFSRLIPAEKAGEFFGLYNIIGKFSTIIGPGLLGFFAQYTGESRYGILSVMILIIVGMVILKKNNI